MNEQASKQIKVIHGEDLRRFGFKGDSVAELKNIVKSIFAFPFDSEVSLKYQDEEGDWVTIVSNSDLSLAFEISKEKILKLTVNVTRTPIAEVPKMVSGMDMDVSPSQPPVTGNMYTFLPQQPTAPNVQPMNTPNVAFGTQYPPYPPYSYPRTEPTTGPQTGFSPYMFPSQRFLHKVQHKAEKHLHKKLAKYESQENFPKGKMGGRFVKHVTVDDNSEIQPGAPFIKTWRFRNESAFPWPEETHLVCVGKDKLSGPESIPVPRAAAPGEEVDVSISLLAPSKPGQYTGYYRLAAGPTGQKFGQRVRVQIQVTGSSDEETSDQKLSSPSWGQLLQQLDQMGFTNKKKNIQLLNKHDGDLDKVVMKLLKKMAKHKY